MRKYLRIAWNSFIDALPWVSRRDFDRVVAEARAYYVDALMFLDDAQSLAAYIRLIDQGYPRMVYPKRIGRALRKHDVERPAVVVHRDRAFAEDDEVTA